MSFTEKGDEACTEFGDKKRKFTEFSDEFFTVGYSAHIWFFL